jgi:hypothetical protein
MNIVLQPRPLLVLVVSVRPSKRLQSARPQDSRQSDEKQVAVDRCPVDSPQEAEPRPFPDASQIKSEVEIRLKHI